VGGDRAGLTPLANALVEARLLTRGGGTLEVAHEALLRRQPIAGWLEEQKDALKLRDDVLREAKEWEGGGKHADGLVRRGARLDAALSLLADKDFQAALAPADAYLKACGRMERAGRRRAWWAQAAIFVLMLGVIGVLLAQRHERELNSQWFKHVTAGRHVVPAAAAMAMPQTKPFWDCARTDADYSRHCPGMVVVPEGKFMMGEKGDQREVTIAKPFAVSIHEVTFDQWDACVAAGGCKSTTSGVGTSRGWGRGRRPAINVNWHDAQDYVKWLSSMTGHTYRLLTEAEWEYAARAGTQTRWSFDGDESKLGEYAWFTSNSKSKPQPVGKRKSNAFGLYDMHGNVWEWVEDCYISGYKGVPSDGRPAPDTKGCSRVLRGGSWFLDPDNLRSANRYGVEAGVRSSNVGFRVVRVLSPART
jgi:formylglycine-generating enzyme required for sulfatase activity